MEFIALADFLAEAESVAGFQTDELVRVGRVSLGRLVEPLAVEPRCLGELVLFVIFQKIEEKVFSRRTK